MQSSVYMNLSGVRPSVRPCVQSSSRTLLLRVRCCRPDGQEISIDCCMTGAQQQLRHSSGVRRPNAGSATLSADAES